MYKYFQATIEPELEKLNELMGTPKKIDVSYTPSTTHLKYISVNYHGGIYKVKKPIKRITVCWVEV